MKAFFGVLVLALAQTSLASYIRYAPDCGCNGPIIAPINPCNQIIAPINPCNQIIAPINPCNQIIAPINPCNPIIDPIYTPMNPMYSAPVSVVQQNSVASSLADTLSLLTVSSLLSDTLPLGPNMILPVPNCGCGYGYGCGCNSGYGTVVVNS